MTAGLTKMSGDSTILLCWNFRGIFLPLVIGWIIQQRQLTPRRVYSWIFPDALARSRRRRLLVDRSSSDRSRTHSISFLVSSYSTAAVMYLRPFRSRAVSSIADVGAGLQGGRNQFVFIRWEFMGARPTPTRHWSSSPRLRPGQRPVVDVYCSLRRGLHTMITPSARRPPSTLPERSRCMFLWAIEYRTA